MAKLSALVCVRNEEARLAQCLARLAFCDEIVVVADRCEDGTEAIALDMGAKVVSGSFPLEGRRKRVGVEACAGDWILEVDADELVPTALAHEIRRALDGAAGDYFQLPVDNYVGERLVRRGWGGSFGTSSVARLYRRGVKHWKDHRVHPGVTFTGVLASALTTPIRHKVDDDIADMVARLNRYTDLRALDLADAAKPKLGLGDNLFRGLRRFAKCYWSRQGYKEGELGLLIALMAGLYPILSCLKAREILSQRAGATLEHSADLVELRPAPPTRQSQHDDDREIAAA